MDGRMIPYHTFYRSGSLSRMNEEEIEEFKTLGIKYILDLRSKRETDMYPDPYFEGVKYLRHSGVQIKAGKDIDFSPTGMRQMGLNGKEQFYKLKHVYYRNIPFENEAFHVLIDNVVDKKVPIIFHCASGKDRTGVAAMILLALLGVDEETIIKDYLLTNEILKDRIEAELEKSKDLIKQDPDIIKLLRMIEGVIEEIGREVISAIKDKYGTFENYFLEEYGLDDKKIAELRDYYLI